jgi:hypothetical protein
MHDFIAFWRRLHTLLNILVFCSATSRRVEEHLKVLSEYRRSTSFCIWPALELVGSSGRIGVAIQNSWVIELWLPNHFTFGGWKRKLPNPKANVCYTDMCKYILHSSMLNVSILMQMPRITTTIQILIHICSLMKKHSLVSTPSTAWWCS